MCTAVPPAKSTALSLLAIQPPSTAVAPLKANTQCATGKYTMLTHSAVNASHGPKRIRSATAPEISATVMMANIIWKATNTVAGMVPTSGIATVLVPLPPISPRRPKYCVGSPIRLPVSCPKATEYP